MSLAAPRGQKCARCLFKRKKKIKKMVESIETVIMRRQQKFDLHDVLNPAKIEITDDGIINKLSKLKRY